MRFPARAVVLTTGTFLSGLIHVGLENYQAGRAGDPPAVAPGAQLARAEAAGRALKTGTPPRIDGRSIDFSVMTEQPGDDPVPVFSFLGSREQHPRQLPCWITHTNARTHDIIRGGLDRSPMFTGVIEGVGPRYCPSIEDKILRFADKASHQIFLEPEGLDDPRVLSQRHLDEPAVRRAARARALDQRVWSTRISPGPAMRSSTTISIRARSKASLETESRSRACSSPARSTARPATKKPRRKACSPASMRRLPRAAKGAGARGATRRISACWSTT